MPACRAGGSVPRPVVLPRVVALLAPVLVLLVERVRERRTQLVAHGHVDGQVAVVVARVGARARRQQRARIIGGK